MTASLQLTEQGRLFLEAKRPDDAIAILERAVHLSPSNGQNYYYLAEAWIMKGEADQAREYNDLARIYLENDPAWIRRAEAQRKRLNDIES